MNIAVWHNLKGGGAKRALYEQVKGLVARGHQVQTWCPDTADLDYLPLSEFGPRNVLPLPRSEASGLSGTLRALKSMDDHARSCADSINRGGFDVLLAYPCFFHAVPPIGRHVRVPSLLFLHEPCRRLYEALPQLPWVAPPAARGTWWMPRTFKRTIENMLATQGLRIQAREELRSVRAFSRVLVNSRFSRESVLRAYGIESRVCYLGVDTATFNPSGADRELFVLGMGGLFPVKRPDRAVRALAAIPPAKRPPFVWVGHFEDPAYRRDMESLAKSLGVEFDARIGLPESEVIEHLGRASALLYTPQLEPFGFAPLEANACETPVIAIAEGGIRETIIDGLNGFLADGDDPSQLAALLTRLLDSPESARRMGAAARDHVTAHWPWPASIDRLETHLTEIAASS
ncbi:MAG: glycosyltransferase family 4 protein [Candidatus Hydrogenedentes bacterium]|nr:glycosyltransferase family 4 protein [Candidatus Hydrogenedentota bacterium]